MKPEKNLKVETLRGTWHVIIEKKLEKEKSERQKISWEWGWNTDTYSTVSNCSLALNKRCRVENSKN